MKGVLYKYKYNLAILEESIRDFKATNEKITEQVVSKMATPKNNLTIEYESVEKVKKVANDVLVDIKEMAIQNKGEKITFKFNLVNVQKEKRPVKGYVHVIALNKELDPPQFYVYPKQPIKDGIPVDYRHGYTFFIKNFKPIRGEHLLDTKTESPSSIKVLVYNKSGSLIFQKEFEVE